MRNAVTAELPAALLADATWYGTLAAARDLGSRGVPVTLAAGTPLAPARWSRFVSRVAHCASAAGTPEFVDWLLRLGKQHPGHVLYPTSDDAAWAIAAHRAELEPLYRLFSPPIETYARLLDKGALCAAARSAGLEVPDTWLPSDEAEVERIAQEATFPLIVKPRTMVLGFGRNKAERVERRDDLVRIWRSGWMSDEQKRLLGPAMRDAWRPMIQAYHSASERIYTLDAFIDRTGEMLAVGCHKLLQRPRRVGPGLVFEEAPLDERLAKALQRLCLDAGFFGIIDVEFLIDGERRLLIDLNPRLYNHVAFEIDRGLPLPWLAYLSAVGDEAMLRDAWSAARESARFAGGRAYVHRLPTEIMLAAQWAFGTIEAEEWRQWHRWIARHGGCVTDPTHRSGDRAPALADVASHAAEFALHPRSFIGHLAFIRGRRGDRSAGASWEEPGGGRTGGDVGSTRAG